MAAARPSIFLEAIVPAKREIIVGSEDNRQLQGAGGGKDGRRQRSVVVDIDQPGFFQLKDPSCFPVNGEIPGILQAPEPAAQRRNTLADRP